MTERIEIPAEVLDVFRKIKAAADASVEFLEAIQPPPVAAGTTHHVSVSDSATFGERATKSVTIYPEPIRTAIRIPTPTVEVFNPPALPTVPEVKMARAWVEGSKTALRAAELLIMAEGLLQLADRLLGIHQ